jgi:hypothetical protein
MDRTSAPPQVKLSMLRSISLTIGPLAAYTVCWTTVGNKPAAFPEVDIKKSKIHRLSHRFSIDFSLLGLAYGFLSQSPRFLFGHHKHLTEVLGFWFAVEVFKVHRQVWIFIRFFVFI